MKKQITGPQTYIIHVETKEKMYHFAIVADNYPDALLQTDQLVDMMMGFTGLDKMSLLEQNLIAVTATDR